MAKKDERKALGGIFNPTEAPTEETKRDIIKPTSFGLAISERAELQRIADENGIARNAIGRFAIQLFIKQYNKGAVKLPVVKVKKLQAP
jgi:hypothetical protein